MGIIVTVPKRLILSLVVLVSALSGSKLVWAEDVVGIEDVKTMLADSAMKYCFKHKCHIALIKVIRAEVLEAGTPYEQTKIVSSVRQLLYGELKGNVTLTRFTNHGDSILTENKQFLVAVSEIPLFMPHLLLNGFVEVPLGQETAITNLHLTRIQQQSMNSQF